MKKLYLILTVLVAFLMFFAGSCSKDDNTPVTPPSENPPSFSATAQPVTLVGGDAGLAFYARCTTDDVNMVSVKIENPRGQSITYNAGNILVLKNEEFECQTPGTGYYKYLGTWKLTFVGNKATGTKSSFSVLYTLNVTGQPN